MVRGIQAPNSFRAARLGNGDLGSARLPFPPPKACFAIVDFPALLRGELPPPRVPTVRGPLDVSNFDDYEMDDKYLKGGPYRGSPTDWDYSF